MTVIVHGLAELRRDLRKMDDAEALPELRDGLKEAADVVVRDAKQRVPVRSGRARDALRATAGGNKAFVVGGKAKVRYYGWLDFGSRSPRTGNPRTVGPWRRTGKGPPKGRFIYPALDAKEHEVVRVVEKHLDAALKKVRL